MSNRKTVVITGTHNRVGPEADERHLVAQAKSGSSSAFGQLYERHRLRVYNTTYRVLHQSQDAEDAVQRCFQRAFTNLARFREDSTFSTWVTRIAINEALMLLRQRRTTVPLTEVGHDDGETPCLIEFVDRAPSPEQTVAGNEVRDALTQAVSRLRKNLRAVILLREFRGFTCKETARHLGLTVAAVKARIFHARRCLRQNLDRKLMSVRHGCAFGSRTD